MASGQRPNTAACLPSTRRRLLKTGLMGAALLAGSGWLARHGRSGSARAGEAPGGIPGPNTFRAFHADHLRVLGAVAPVILSADWPEEEPARSQALAVVLKGSDAYMARMSPPVQEEARDALDLLDMTLVRVLLGGMWSDWEEAGSGEIAGFLAGLRGSSLALKRTLYQFLHDMCLIGWYGNPRSWAALGYPGPPDVPRPEGERPL